MGLFPLSAPKPEGQGPLELGPGWGRSNLVPQSLWLGGGEEDCPLLCERQDLRLCASTHSRLQKPRPRPSEGDRA